jgi:sterol 3beta-glucosyltransferase
VASIKDIKPVESKRPRHLIIIFEANTGTVEATVEFDTDESAQDWRRELLGAFRPCRFQCFPAVVLIITKTGALFLYRRNSRLILMQDDAEDQNAVRINIPLSRVEAVEKTNMLSFFGHINVTFDPKSSNGASIDQVSSSEDISLLDTVPDKQVLQFGILRKNSAWDHVMTYVDNAKTSASEGSVDWPGSRVYVDVDPRSSESAERSDTNLSNLIKSVSFALGLDTTKEIWSTSCSFFLSSPSSHYFLLVQKAHIHRFVVSYSGRFAVNAECLGFWSKSITGTDRDLRYRVPLSRVKVVKPHDRGLTRDHTLAIEIEGQHDLRLGFATEQKRDEAIDQINRFIGLSQSPDRLSLVSSPTSLTPASSPFFSSEESLAHKRVRTLDQISESPLLADDASYQTHHSSTAPLPSRNATSILAPLSRVPSTLQKQHLPHALKSILPKAINVPEGVLLSMPSKHFVCLTIGSRGDVQPYIALGRGLQKEGHRVTIVTHEEYKEWVTGFGVDHRTAGGDPGALMKLSVENKVIGIWTTPSVGPRSDSCHANRCSHLNSSRRACLMFVFSLRKVHLSDICCSSVLGSMTVCNKLYHALYLTETVFL